MPAPARRHRSDGTRLTVAALAVLLGTLSLAEHWRGLLSGISRYGSVIHVGLWVRIVTMLGGTYTVSSGLGNYHSEGIDLGTLLSIFIPMTLASWLAGAWLIAKRAQVPYRHALAQWGLWGWLWWLMSAAWDWIPFVSMRFGELDDPLWRFWTLVELTLPLWHGLMWAGWLTTGIVLAGRPEQSVQNLAPEARLPLSVWGAMLLYVAIFGAMNWGLYESLRLPHGDSAMYEEHLWNLLHGKGFRSYLDNGRLFLGEHVQVIHLLLIPLYVLWPSQMLLELCQSAALAAGAIPLFRIGLRHNGSRQAAICLATAYLLYVPMQTLDIAADFKTFRPNSFEIPLFLWAFDLLERQRWKSFVGALVLALACQEDAATIVAPLGVWMVVESVVRKRKAERGKPTAGDGGLVDWLTMRWLGAALAVVGVVYVLLVVKVVLPWFRGGEDVHFAQYFTELGKSSDSIALNLLRHPGLVVRRLLALESIGFALTLVAPLGFVSLLSPGRLAIAAPLFILLCLSQITNSAQHHFHAPMVPVIFWAAAAGVGHAPQIGGAIAHVWRWVRRAPSDPDTTSCVAGANLGEKRLLPVETLALWSAMSSLSVGFFLGISPLSLGFWDPDSPEHWSIYLPDARSRQVAAVLEQIPPGSRVASTDYIHTRLTHRERSYDYSSYRPNVPDDADYLVVDVHGRYSQVRGPRDVKEYRDHPEEWELLPDRTDGYFIILKRKQPRE